MIFNHIMTVCQRMDIQVYLLFLFHRPLTAERALRDAAVVPGQGVDHPGTNIIDLDLIAFFALNKSAGTKRKRLLQQLVSPHPELVGIQHGPHPLFCGLFLERYPDFLIQRQIGPIFRHRFRHPKAFPGAPDLFAAVVLPVVVERRYIPAVPLLPQVDLAVEIIFHAIVPQPL